MLQEEFEMVDWRQRIESRPDVCQGTPCIRGTRIMVSVLLDNLAEGLAAEEVVADYPPLTLEDVLAAVAYGRVEQLERHSASADQ
jgi:uncharacterized protein (DUF433 family)